MKRVGRRLLFAVPCAVILAGCAIAAITYVPLFHSLRHAVNPAIDDFNQKTQITVADQWKPQSRKARSRVGHSLAPRTQ